MSKKDFIDISKLDAKLLQSILAFAKKVKSDDLAGVSQVSNLLENKQVALVFEKPSTRTRISFEAAINKLGGKAIVIQSHDSQLNRGETIADTAKVLSQYVDLIMFRCFHHDTLLEMAQNATIPVINGLTDYSHPCQVLADIMTFEETKGSIAGKKVAWIGDSNNMANTWIQAAEKLSFNLVMACPQELAPIAKLPDCVKVVTDPKEAAKDADLVTTDTWTSMGDEEVDTKRALLADYQVDDSVMESAKPQAIFMHCLPAHRGEEVSASVIDGPQSVVWEEAKNRLYVQLAIMLWCTDRMEGGKVVSPKPFKGAKVLLVEDNKADMDVAHKLLDSIGCEVVVAHDGQEAIGKAKNDSFDVIFMDCLMPIMNGFDAAHVIRENEKGHKNHVPIIAVTNESSESVIKRGAQVGMNDFIQKPIGPKRVTELLTKWYKKAS